MINVAIVGTGSISGSHIRAYLNFPEKCKLKVFVSRKLDNAIAKAKEFGLEIEVVESYEEILNREDIHLVSICTPPYTHADMAIDFLKSKKHIIIEKPMALSLEECDAMIKAAKDNNRILSVVAQNRYTDSISKLKQTIDSKLIGDIFHAQVDAYSWRGSNYYDLWWRGTWEKEGGGATINQGIHHIDLLNWIMGLPDEVTAVMANSAHKNCEMEDISISMLKYKNGALGQITASVIHHGEERQMIFQGSGGRISSPWRVYSSKSRGNGFPEEDKEKEREIQLFYDAIPDLAYSKHEGQIFNVLSAIEQDTKPEVDGIDGRNAIEVVTAIYKSASTGKSIKLPILKKDPYYTLEGILKSVPYFHKKVTYFEQFPD